MPALLFTVNVRFFRLLSLGVRLSNSLYAKRYTCLVGVVEVYSTRLGRGADVEGEGVQM